MTGSDIAHQRLLNQHIAGTTFKKPSDVVAWLGAVQAQEYTDAKWALGLRMENATDAIVEQAFNEGAFLRTHLMRPTWHFVSPADIRWILELTAPRVHAVNAHMYRRLELDDALFARCVVFGHRRLLLGHHTERTFDVKLAAAASRSTFL